MSVNAEQPKNASHSMVSIDLGNTIDFSSSLPLKQRRGMERTLMKY